MGNNVYSKSYDGTQFTKLTNISSYSSVIFDSSLNFAYVDDTIYRYSKIISDYVEIISAPELYYNVELYSRSDLKRLVILTY